MDIILLNPRLICKCVNQSRDPLPQVFPYYLSILKTILVMFPFFPDAMIKDHTMLWGDSGRSLFMMVVSRRGVEVHPWAPYFGHSMVLDCVRLTIHSSVISINVGQAGVDVISSSNLKISGKIVPMAVLITNRVEKRSLDMMTTFCQHDQVKVESLEALSTFCQWDSPKPRVVEVRIFANSPYFTQGYFASLTWM